MTVNWDSISMRTASFWLNHPEGKSRALAEFAIHKNKAYLLCLMFVHGNVVDLSAYAACKKKAQELLSDPYFSPTG